MTDLPEIMKYALLLLTFLSAPGWALNFTSTYLRLNCPSRGIVEITLHVYGHVSELWNGHFEVGAGHRSHNGMELVKFINGDLLIHQSSSDEFLFRYVGEKNLRHCQKLSENPVNVQSIPYYRSASA